MKNSDVDAPSLALRDTFDTTRRTVAVYGIAALSAAVALSSSVAVGRMRLPVPPHLLRPELAAVGQAMLKSPPFDDDLSRPALERDLRPILQSRPTRADSISDIRQKIGDDFAVGRTVTFRGWMLSETEAKICILVSHIFSGTVSANLER